ncbi:MAG: polyprenyl synthetase family protein [Rhodospirillaceae bacterium]|nr:polyprenyl synthetase family protein [Rhodospirillaceae bacterium]
MPLSEAPEDRVVEAMRYACLNGGKRLRPFFVMQTAALFHVDTRAAVRAAAAVEMLHCYSLIHDDLPAMDDDNLRRGLPTVHRRFDEATAILAGDALLTAALGTMADPDVHADPAVRCELVSRLAAASGAHGMVGGQMLDLLAEHQDLDIAAITRLQRMKTGCLIAFSCECGAILGRASCASRQALLAYAHDVGLAFQIADDLLDVEGQENDLGKATAKDAERGKASFVAVLGVERARAQARLLIEQAIAHLDVFEGRAALLAAAARFVVDRQR